VRNQQAGGSPYRYMCFSGHVESFQKQNKQERLFLPLLSYPIQDQKETKTLRDQIIHDAAADVLL